MFIIVIIFLIDLAELTLAVTAQYIFRLLLTDNFGEPLHWIIKMLTEKYKNDQK